MKVSSINERAFQVLENMILYIVTSISEFAEAGTFRRRRAQLQFFYGDHSATNIIHGFVEGVSTKSWHE